MSWEFKNAASDAGLLIHGDPINDGRIHRCATKAHPRKFNGAYLLFQDSLRGGFQNWEIGAEWCKWVHPDVQRFSPPSAGRFSLPRIVRDDHEGRLAAIAAARRAAAASAAILWASGAEGRHPYLDAKGICSVSSRVVGERLMIPMRNIDGKLMSLQFIVEGGKKWFMRDGEAKGAMCVLKSVRKDPSKRPTYLCEGYATAATVYAATGGDRTVACFSCGGLVEVAKRIRAAGKAQNIIVCADNDHKTTGNPGVTHAKLAAEEVGGKLIVPEGIAGTDFNDMMLEKGIFFVEDYIAIKTRSA